MGETIDRAPAPMALRESRRRASESLFAEMSRE
jgi:hypothetical protein